MPQYFKDHGVRLVELGYSVLPIDPGTKACTMSGWRTRKLTADDVERMALNGSANSGAGILASTTPAIDVDVLDATIAARMWDFVVGILPEGKRLWRTGRAPKFAVPTRTDRPFRKISSSVYTDGKRDHKVEILCDGQQWVAYAEHPDTGKPYQFGPEELYDTPRSELPELNVNDALRIVDEFERLASIEVQAMRWRLKTSSLKEKPVDDPFAQHVQPVGMTEQEVAGLLDGLPNDDADYDQWFTTLCAIHHELGETGRELAYEWSSRSSKHTDRKFEQTWESLGRYSGRPTTLRALLKKAGVIHVPAREHPEATKEDPVPFTEGSSFAAGFEDVDWLIEDVIPRAQVGVVYGASGSGKTFFALDLACTIHRGIAWRNKHVEQADVFYIAAEAGAGIRKRIAAYVQNKGEGPMPWFVDYQPNLATLESAHAISTSVKRRSSCAGVIFIDTLALSHDGEENSSKDMSIVLRHCKIIADDTGALVVLVHHTGKDESKGMRGSSAIYAASDFVLEITSEGKNHAMFVDKLKDGERGAQFGFSLPAVQVGVTPRGKPITSCYVAEAAPVLRTGLKPLVVPAQIFIMDVFRSAIGIAIDMTEDELVEAVKERQRSEDNVPSQTQSIKKSIAKMIISGHFCKEGERLKAHSIAHSAHSDEI